MKTESIFTNASVVTRDAVFDGTVVVSDGLISSVDQGASHLPGAIDCHGDLLIPGLVELHTDNLERHVVPRPSATWPVDAATLAHDREVVSAGITTVFDAISVGEVHAKSRRSDMLKTLCAALERRRASDDLVADHRLHLRCELAYGEMIAMLEPLLDEPQVALISLMDHTPGQRQFRDIAVYARYYQGKFGLSDEELAEFIDDRRRDQLEYARSNRDYVVAVARERGISIASHDDATSEHVSEAVENGAVIAEFPTAMDAARASKASGLSVLMGAPNLVRGSSHSGNVSARDLAAAGFLDILSSDYVPSSLLLGALMLARLSAEIDLAAAVRTVTLTPALRVGLTDRGEIAPGKRGDLVRVRERDDVAVIRGVWRGGEKVA